MTQKCGEGGFCLKRLCSTRLAENANGNIVTRIGTSNEAAYQIGMTAHFVCNLGYYHANDWHHQEKAVICLTTDDNASQKWMPVDGSSLVPCVKGMKNIFVFEFIDILSHIRGARPLNINFNSDFTSRVQDRRPL